MVSFREHRAKYLLSSVLWWLQLLHVACVCVCEAAAEISDIPWAATAPKPRRLVALNVS